MNEKSTRKTAFGLDKEEFFNLKEEINIADGDSFEDKALEKFIKKPNSRTKLKLDLFFMFILFTIIFLGSIIGGVRGGMEAYVAFPVAILALIGIIIIVNDVKKDKNFFS